MFTITPADKSYRAHAWLVTLAVVIVLYWRHTLSQSRPTGVSHWNVPSLIVTSITLHLLSLRCATPERSSALRLTLPTDRYRSFLRFRYITPSRRVWDCAHTILLLCGIVAWPVESRLLGIGFRLMDKLCWVTSAVYLTFLALEGTLQAREVRDGDGFRFGEADVGRKWTKVASDSTRKLDTWVRWIGDDDEAKAEGEQVWELKMTKARQDGAAGEVKHDEPVGQILRISRSRTRSHSDPKHVYDALYCQGLQYGRTWL